MTHRPLERHLLIDKGNTIAKVLLVDDGRFASEIITLAELREELLSPYCQVAPGGRLYTVYSSVGEFQPEAVTFLKHCSDYFLEVDATTASPLRNIRYQRVQLGADRLALAVGALEYTDGEEDVLAIDIGTAITYEWVSAQGDYLGGNISPGPRTRIFSLHQATALLPMVDLCLEVPEIGSSTEEAILAGVVWGIVYEIEGYIQYMHSKSPRLKVILTGGYAPYFAGKVKNVTFVEPNLVLRGLDRLLEYNVQNSK